jgi:hypothetical protein
VSVCVCNKAVILRLNGLRIPSKDSISYILFHASKPKGGENEELYLSKVNGLWIFFFDKLDLRFYKRILFQWIWSINCKEILRIYEKIECV